MKATDQQDGAAAVLAALGRVGDCIEALETHSPPRAHGVHQIYYGSEFDSMREDPRFVSVLRKHGVKELHDRAQAWRAAHRPKMAPKK